MAIITSDKLLSFLRKRNFVELGSGLYSDVFAPPASDRVIKVCRNTDAWIDYALWATKNGYAGTFAPKVYSIKPIPDGYVAIMERLKGTMKVYREGPAYSGFKAIQSLLYDNQPISPEIEDKCRGLTAFGKDLHKFARGKSIDMHGGNAMIRENGSLVITDPFQGENHQPIPERMRAYDLAMTRNAQFANQKAYAKHR